MRLSTTTILLLIIGVYSHQAAAAYVKTVTGDMPQPVVAVANVCAWPNLTMLGDGTIAAAIFNQPNHGATEGDVDVWTSGDNGVSWQLAGTAAPHDPNTNRMNIAAGLATDGDMLVISSGWSNDPPSGFRSGILDPWLCRSGDNGETWTIDKTAVPNASPRGNPIVPYGDIVQGTDGVLRAAVYDWPGYNSTERTYIISSTDGGATWGGFVPLDPDNVRNETALLNLGGDDWLAVARAGGSVMDMYLYSSSDNAASWQPQGKITGSYEHPGHLMRLQDGGILLTYSDRNDNPLQGVEVLLSKDEGVTWSAPMRVLDYSGPDGGYPSSVQLPDGQILTAYYAQGITGYSGYHMGTATWDPVKSFEMQNPNTEPGTVGFWQFNEKPPGSGADAVVGSILDSSGNGHHGTAVGDPLPVYIAGPNDPTSAIVLLKGGASEDRVTIPHSADFNLMLADLQDYTIEAIVKLPPEERSAQGIMTKRDTTGMGWSLRTLYTGELSLYIQGTGLNFTDPGINGTIDIFDGKWHHVAAVIDANADAGQSEVTFYVDHAVDCTVLITDAIYNDGDWVNENIVNFQDVWIGDFIGRPDDQLVGAIDAVRFSRGMLTPDEFLNFAPTRPGDANGDGKVDEVDAARLAANWLGAGGWEQGDFNGDGTVNDLDASLMAANWHHGVSQASVPEPGVFALLVSVLAALFFIKRNRTGLDFSLFLFPL